MPSPAFPIGIFIQNFVASASPIRRVKQPERSPSIPQTASFIWSSPMAQPRVMVSALAGMDLRGSGGGIIHWRQPWPRWKPPAKMKARQPELEKYSIANGGMDPGVQNPLGARALDIFQNGQDTLYRMHGNPEWKSIDKAVSSGCVRLLNHDIVDLYDRVPYHAPIVVHHTPLVGTA
ncbi:hypothetical protein GGE29_004287 [Agrobacterium tumefaciens]|jgi:hypothetical protein|nr:hypothetical protein [Agrobacterium radiobacter]MBB4454328.1 hypothetical protein [Agrobacterium radiobacter]MBP2542381.1 hypothetical protein [Agrobacterium tumefaciens]MCP2137686.1 hypothetical protein [Rhizobium sp. SLBN-94]CUX50205.1 hypothetical protein AGR4B_Lc70099 [Agrobacterium tumefaciens str. CFBP 5621]